jgi:hypothetical protein
MSSRRRDRAHRQDDGRRAHRVAGTLALEGVTDRLYEIPEPEGPKRAKLALGGRCRPRHGVGRRRHRAAMRGRARGSGVLIASPGGTANLFASNLGIPKDIAKAADRSRRAPPDRRAGQRRAVRGEAPARATHR